jgi:hypothetical protein
VIGDDLHLGPLYLLKGDLAGALRSFAWFEQHFPDDIGEPGQYLCWTLALFQSRDRPAAHQKLLQTMLMNVYIIPHLLGMVQQPLDMWHGSNMETLEYLQYIPPELFRLWDQAALNWVAEAYESAPFIQARARYIEIYRQLKDEPVGPQRSQLVKEAMALRHLRIIGW